MKLLSFLLENETVDEKTIRIIGSIDERAIYPDLSQETVKTINLDLSGIELVNSTGIQKWIKFFEKIPSSIGLRFLKCNTRIIHQINQFPGLLAGRDNIIYVSFFAPYFCEDCDRSIDVLIDCDDHESSLEKFRAPTVRCDVDPDHNMEFDSIEKKYFRFLKGDTLAA